MTINCPKCGNQIELPEGLVEGQHVQCPYCGEKFEYRNHKPSRIEVPDRKPIEPHRGWQYKFANFLVQSTATVFGFAALIVFWNGWASLPEVAMIPSSWYGNIPELQSKNCELTAFCAHALIACGKMFAGFVFAKVTVTLFHNSTSLACKMCGEKSREE